MFVLLKLQLEKFDGYDVHLTCKMQLRENCQNGYLLRSLDSLST